MRQKNEALDRLKRGSRGLRVSSLRSGRTSKGERRWLAMLGGNGSFVSAMVRDSEFGKSLAQNNKHGGWALVIWSLLDRLWDLLGRLDVPPDANSLLLSVQETL